MVWAHLTVTASTMIARFNSAHKVRCHDCGNSWAEVVLLQSHHKIPTLRKPRCVGHLPDILKRSNPHLSRAVSANRW
jgi:hypothetical protein